MTVENAIDDSFIDPIWSKTAEDRFFILFIVSKLLFETPFGTPSGS
jgi:hypothetical protein